MNKWYNSNERFKIKPASRILTHTGVSHKNCCVCKKPYCWVYAVRASTI